MRRIFRIPLLGLAAGVVSACNPDEVITTENIPTAGVRFINAVPDTNNLDFRFIDFVESNAHFRMQFRNSIITSGGVPASTSVQYKNTRAGTRSYRIFLNDTLQNVASTVINEGTMTIDPDRLYTVLLWGYASAGQAGSLAPPGVPAMTIDIYEETVTDPGASVALRVINATPFTIDAYYRPIAGAFSTPTWDNIPAMTRSAYVTAAADTLFFQVQDQASTADLFADARALVGRPANSSGATDPVTGILLPCGGTNQPKCDIEATPGTTIAGSALTAIVFPGSVPCSTAPQTTAFLFTAGARTDLAATSANTFTRNTGSFITDGYAVGQIVGVCGFTQAANNGLFTVTGRTATTLSVTPIAGGSTVLEAGNPASASAAGVFSAVAGGYARTTGSFVTEGFVPGMEITVSGFTQVANNGRSTVATVSPTSITVTKTPAPVLEAATTGLTSLGVSATGYTRSAGSFITEGWVPGQPVTASGFLNAQNNGLSSVSAVTATELTVAKIGGLVAELEAPGRAISSSSTRSLGNATLRTVAAPRPAISFIWDRRPPRVSGT